MARYLISFNDGDMTFPDEDLPAVGEAAHKVVKEAMAAGVWITGGGFEGYSPQVVGLDGTVKDGPLQVGPSHIGGFSIVDVDSDTEALEWAKKIAVACRCAQEVRNIMHDPELDR